MEFVGELENAKCKMQNAKCKISSLCSVEAFRLRESLFHGNILHADTRKAFAHKRIFKENFSRFSLSRSLILHFAFCISGSAR